MDRDRGDRRDDRRRRDDTRDRRSTYDRNRSRSPTTRDRRDDRRRERSPPRSPRRVPPPPPRSDRGHPSRPDRSRDDNDTRRNRTPLDPRSVNPLPRDGRTPSKQPLPSAPDSRMTNGVEDEDSEAEMKRIMGFKGFRSTKNTKVPGNDKNYGVYKAKASEYRQYMNRTGGFNRALSPSRD